MKRILSVICAGVMAAASFTFSSPVATAETVHHENVLVAYFSRAGENYNVGVVERGNTELLAEIVAEETGGDVFRIETVREYPSAYDEMLTVATQERTEHARPDLKTEIEYFDSYDVILVGYPIWWADMPMAMYTFFESYDWRGKTIIPFNTHEGSGQSGTVSSIREICSDATVMSGFSVRGSVAQNNGESARAVVQNWLDSNDFASLVNKNEPVYTIQDVRNLQDFLLAKPTEEDLRGKPYDLDGDGVWNVFDLCLMKRKVFQEVDAVSSATVDVYTNEVMNEYRKTCDAMINQDIDTPDSQMADDLVLQHITGATQTKQEWLDCIANGEMQYHDIEIKSLSAEIVDGYVVLNHTSIIEATIYGSHGTWTLSGTSYYQETDGKWIRVNPPKKQ